MGLLKRLSDGFWSCVSPATPSEEDGGVSVPGTYPRLRPIRKSEGLRHQRRDSLHTPPFANNRTSSSRKRTLPEDSTPRPARKVRAVKSPGHGSSGVRITTAEDEEEFSPGGDYADLGSSPMVRVKDEFESPEEDENPEDGMELDQNDGQEDQQGDEDDEELEQDDDAEDDDDGDLEDFAEGDDSLIVTAEEYEYNPSRPRKMTIPAPNGPENSALQDDLRREGWAEDHLELYTRLARRGFEPILPAFFKFELHWMPDILFCGGDDSDSSALINSAHAHLAHARRALEDLFNIGPAMRDALLSPNHIPPEKPFRRLMTSYLKWAARDSGLDLSTAIPLAIVQVGHPDTPIPELRVRAERRLARLAQRYREALRVARSIEISSAGAASSSPSSPGRGAASSPSTQLADEVPTLYAFVCKDTTVVLAGFRPADEVPTLKSVATFRFEDPDYDIWSAFGLAIAVCHCRNVQLRIAEDTGIGVKIPGGDGDRDGEDEDDDPDA